LPICTTVCSPAEATEQTHVTTNIQRYMMQAPSLVDFEAGSNGWQSDAARVILPETGGGCKNKKTPFFLVIIAEPALLP
jgi:hypothetical protein